MEEHYQKFAIMGIFGTVSVFLSGNFPGENSAMVARIGTFASLIIFSLAAIWICFHAFGIVFNEFAQGRRPLPTEIGFIVLALCTGALVYSIGAAITNYEEVYTASRQLAVILVIIVVYIRVFPLSELSTDSKSGQNMVPMGMILAFLFLVSLSTGGDLILNSITSYETIRIAVGAAGAGILHIYCCLSVRGYIRILQERDLSFYTEQINELIQTRTLPVWSIDTSALFSAFIFSVYTYLIYSNFSFTNNVGYFSIADLHWESFIIYHLMAISILHIVRLFDNIADDNQISNINPLFISAVTAIVLFSELVLIELGYIGVRVVPM